MLVFLTSLVKQSLFKCCLDVLRQMRRRIRLKLFTTSGRHRSIFGKRTSTRSFFIRLLMSYFSSTSTGCTKNGNDYSLAHFTLCDIFFYKKSPGNYHFELFCILLAQAMFASQAAVDQLFSHQ